MSTFLSPNFSPKEKEECILRSFLRETPLKTGEFKLLTFTDKIYRLVEKVSCSVVFRCLYQQNCTFINKKPTFYAESLDTLGYSDIFVSKIYLQTF